MRILLRVDSTACRRTCLNPDRSGSYQITPPRTLRAAHRGEQPPPQAGHRRNERTRRASIRFSLTRRKPKPPSKSHWPGAVPGSPAPNPRDAPAHQNSTPTFGPHRSQPAAPTYGPSPPPDPTSRQPKRSPPTANRNAAQPRTPSEQPDPAAPPDTSPASSALS